MDQLPPPLLEEVIRLAGTEGIGILLATRSTHNTVLTLFRTRPGFAAALLVNRCGPSGPLVFYTSALKFLAGIPHGNGLGDHALATLESMVELLGGFNAAGLRPMLPGVLTAAVSSEHAAVVRYLLQQGGVRPDDAPPVSGKSPLAIAASKPDRTIFQLLIDAGATDPSGVAVSAAVSANSHQAVGILLAAGAPPFHGLVPACTSCCCGPSMLRLLLEGVKSAAAANQAATADAAARFTAAVSQAAAAHASRADQSVACAVQAAASRYVIPNDRAKLTAYSRTSAEAAAAARAASHQATVASQLAAEQSQAAKQAADDARAALADYIITASAAGATQGLAAHRPRGRRRCRRRRGAPANSSHAITAAQAAAAARSAAETATTEGLAAATHAQVAARAGLDAMATPVFRPEPSPPVVSRILDAFEDLKAAKQAAAVAISQLEAAQQAYSEQEAALTVAIVSASAAGYPVRVQLLQEALSELPLPVERTQPHALSGGSG